MLQINYLIWIRSLLLSSAIYLPDGTLSPRCIEDEQFLMQIFTGSPVTMPNFVDLNRSWSLANHIGTKLPCSTQCLLPNVFHPQTL
jgi:hypothetical protein